MRVSMGDQAHRGVAAVVHMGEGMLLHRDRARQTVVRQQRQPVRIKSSWLNINQPKSSPEMLLRSLQAGLVIGGWLCLLLADTRRMPAIPAAEIDVADVLRL